MDTRQLNIFKQREQVLAVSDLNVKSVAEKNDIFLFPPKYIFEQIKEFCDSFKSARSIHPLLSKENDNGTHVKKRIRLYIIIPLLQT